MWNFAIEAHSKFCKMITNGNLVDEKVPKWLDKKYMLKVIKSLSSGNSDVQVNLCNISVHFLNIELIFSQIWKFNILNGNNNYNSTFFCEVWYTIDGEKKIAEMVLKIEPENGENYYHFLSEYKMYLEVIPKFESILKEYGYSTEFGPKVLYHSEENGRRILFIDNHINKVFIGTGFRYCTHKEAFMSIKKLAKWHACSMKVNHENPKCIGDFVQGFVRNNQEKYEKCSPDGVQLFIDFLDTQEDLAHYKPYFVKLKTIINGKINSFLSGTGRVRVLNHGDFHGLNVMFKYIDQMNTDPKDVVFVDYQMCVWAPAVLDLNFILGTFFNVKFRTDTQSQNFVIKFYFDCLEKALRKINYRGNMPKLKDLKKDFMEFSFIEVFFMAVSMPVSMLFEDEAREFIIKPGLDAHLKNFHNLLYIRTVKRLLPLYLERGWLDF